MRLLASFRLHIPFCLPRGAVPDARNLDSFAFLPGISVSAPPFCSSGRTRPPGTTVPHFGRLLQTALNSSGRGLRACGSVAELYLYGKTASRAPHQTKQNAQFFGVTEGFHPAPSVHPDRYGARTFRAWLYRRTGCGFPKYVNRYLVKPLLRLNSRRTTTRGMDGNTGPFSQKNGTTAWKEEAKPGPAGAGFT